jgi:arginine N-succinyltransferase
VIDEKGGSPFWDSIAGRFFGMTFQEADEFNGAHGTQFIADLMPKTPVYTAMLPESARAVMGVPHPSGRAAMKMLEREGFQFDCYVDIFDGGPTMTAATDQIRTIRESRELVLDSVADSVDGTNMMLARGRLDEFAACCGDVAISPEETATVSRETAALLGLEPGDAFLAMGR